MGHGRLELGADERLEGRDLRVSRDLDALLRLGRLNVHGDRRLDQTKCR